MNDLFTAFQTWIQGQVNACVDGLLSRTSRLEEERTVFSNAILRLEERVRYYDELRIDDQITGLRMENDSLRNKIIELRDRMVEAAPDEELSSFAERVYECFDSEEFRDAVGDKIADYVDNSDDLVTTSDLCSFIRDNVCVALDVSRY